MVAHMNSEAYEATLATRRATFWSRSRERLWQKGETSGNSMRIIQFGWTAMATPCSSWSSPPGRPVTPVPGPASSRRPRTRARSPSRAGIPTDDPGMDRTGGYLPSGPTG